MTILERSAAAPAESGASKNAMLAAAAVFGALLASSCCILPLGLLSLGVSGAWIGNLTALAPYQPAILLATLAFLASGFWATYRRPKIACAGDSYCARPRSGRVSKAALWAATALVIAALGVDLLAPLLA